jgi:Repeat of unknown function (DUF346)
MDVAVRRYHRSEEINPWPFDKGELGFHENEDVSNADVVFWYIAHMFHKVGDHDNHFHFAELRIQVDIERQQHVFYRGPDGAINHIFWDAPTNKLYHDQWTVLTGAPLAAAGSLATMVTN